MPLRSRISPADISQISNSAANGKSRSATDFQDNSKPCIPLELWRVIFSNLLVLDLCRCAQVCRAWWDLVKSLDSTRWKELFLQPRLTRRWKHPNWPNSIHTDPACWQRTYEKHHILTKQWIYNSLEANCSLSGGILRLFGRRQERRSLHVGPGKRFLTIKGALTSAGPFDRIVLHPAVYQEHFALTLKFPLEIVGAEDPNKVVLTMPIEQQASTGRLANLMLRPSYPRPRGSSSVLIKVTCGHMQIENCYFEQGHIHVTSPGTVDIRYCSFNSGYISFKAVGYSTVSNCLFKPDRVAICVEEPAVSTKLKHIPKYSIGWLELLSGKDIDAFYSRKVKSVGIKSKMGHVSDNAIPSLIEEVSAKNHVINDSKTVEKGTSSDEKSSSVVADDVKKMLKSSQGIIIMNNKMHSGRGGITVCRMGQAWIEKNEIHHLVFGVRCLQNSKMILVDNKIHSCETSAVFMREHSAGIVAGNHIFSNTEAGIDLRSGANPYIQHNEIHSGRRSGIVCLDNGKGLIRENNIYNNKEAGVYILYKGNPTVKFNSIWSGRAAGVAVTEDGKGHISHNNICGMEWAGIDIRKGGNPVVSHNCIRKGKADGIVIGEGGKSVIFDNDIQVLEVYDSGVVFKENQGCGIWVLDRAQPLIHSNRIQDCGDSGIVFVSNSDNEHESQQLHAQFVSQEQHQDIVDLAESSEEEDFLPPPLEDEEPESRFVLVGHPEKRFAQVERNTISRNNGHGIYYSGSEGIVISRNTIHCNDQHGVYLTRPSEIAITNNSITFNKMSGVCVEVGVCCTIKGNGMYNNAEYGINSSGTGIVRENDIFAHKLPSILMKAPGDLHITGNRIQSSQRECLRVENGTRGLVNCNMIFHYSFVKPVHKDSTSLALFNSNDFMIVSKNDDIEPTDEEDDDYKLIPIGTVPFRPHWHEDNEGGGLFYTTVRPKANQKSPSISAMSRICVIL